MKKFLYSLLVLPMLLVACGEKKEQTPAPEPTTPKFELTSEASMAFDAEGGEGTITFVYDFTDADAAMVNVACDAEWVEVTNEVAAYAASFTFTVSANENEEARETVIKASVKELFFEVTIKQAGAENGGNHGDEPIEDSEVVEGWAINGTMNDWVKKEATAMTEEGDYFVVYGFELAAEDNFNFIYNGTEKSYGGNGQPAEPNFVYDAKSWGSNISVTEAGTYDVYLSADLKNYYIMHEGVTPAEAEEPLKPGEKRWSIKGDIKGFEDVEISLKKDSKYFTVKNVEFSGEAAFYIYCNSETAYGVANGAECVVEEATNIVENGDAIKVAAVENQKYDLYYLYKEGGASKLWVMPASQYPVVWELVSGGYMPYGNFLCYFVSEDVELTVDFTAGVPVQNYVMPEGTYYVQDTENTGFCFDLQYCQAKIRGFKTMLMDGTMTVEHTANGLYDIFIDMRTPQLDIIKMHWVGEFAFDQYFQMMGGQPINNPEK